MKIEIENLSFSYKKKSPPVLNAVNAVLDARGIVVLTGANGSGKTTLANLILGLLKPDSGTIRMDSRDIAKLSAGSRAQKIGYLFQNPDLQLFAPTVAEELTFPFALTGTLTAEKKAELTELIKKFGLIGAEERFPLTMSGGEKQRLALASVISRGAEYLILDEPTSAIDRDCREYIIRFINEFSLSGGVLVITHDEELIDALDHPRMLRLEGGRLYEA